MRYVSHRADKPFVKVHCGRRGVELPQFISATIPVHIARYESREQLHKDKGTCTQTGWPWCHRSHRHPWLEVLHVTKGLVASRVMFMRKALDVSSFRASKVRSELHSVA